MNYYLLYFSEKYNGDWDKIYNALKYHEIVPKEEIEKLKNQKWKENENFFTILDEEYYPKTFDNIPKSPFLMHYKGNIDLLKSINISKKDDELCILDAKQYLSNNDIAEYLLNNEVNTILVLPCSFEESFIRNAFGETIPNNLLIISEYSGKNSYKKENQKRVSLMIKELNKQLYGGEFTLNVNYFKKWINRLETKQKSKHIMKM